MNDLGTLFRSHILAQEIPGCSISQADHRHYRLETPSARGEVNFYEIEAGAPEIVELSIYDRDCDCEPKFFLHFELDDEARAKELFAEMASVLQEEDLYDTTRVLLCCTAGLTTSMFATKLAEAAKALSIDYSFEALPLTEAQASGGDYDAVLLAPQVGYQRKAVSEAFPRAVVVPIPAKIFAAYDAGAALKLVMHLLSDNTFFPSGDQGDLRVVRDLTNDKRIMVISMINRPRSAWIGWRIYDKGKVADYGKVDKPNPDYRDIEDLLATMHIHGWNVSELDAVGIAVPGVVNRGTVSVTGFPGLTYDLGRSLSKRFGTKVFVDNNANAAAVGCYMSQTEYDSVVLHTQQTGYPIGGQGIVADGHLLKGRKNFAGELGPLATAVHSEILKKHFVGGTLEEAWTPEGMRAIVAPVLACDISLIAPDAIYVAVDLLDDMDALREAVAKLFGSNNEEYLPDFIRITDYRERIALGEMALCLQKLHNPRPHRKH